MKLLNINPANVEAEDCVRLAKGILDRELNNSERSMLLSLFESAFQRGYAAGRKSVQPLRK